MKHQLRIPRLATRHGCSATSEPADGPRPCSPTPQPSPSGRGSGTARPLGIPTLCYNATDWRVFSLSRRKPLRAAHDNPTALDVATDRRDYSLSLALSPQAGRESPDILTRFAPLNLMKWSKIAILRNILWYKVLPISDFGGSWAGGRLARLLANPTRLVYSIAQRSSSRTAAGTERSLQRWCSNFINRSTARRGGCWLRGSVRRPWSCDTKRHLPGLSGRRSFGGRELRS